MKKKASSAPGNGPGITIEWTGAGGDYFLAVVIAGNAVIAERWGTRNDVLEWMDSSWPGVPRKFAPMVYSPVARRQRRPKEEHPLRRPRVKTHYA